MSTPQGYTVHRDGPKPNGGDSGQQEHHAGSDEASEADGSPDGNHKGHSWDDPDWSLLDDLALIAMGLGDKAAAFALVERAIALHPIGRDAANSPQSIDILARVAARLGEPDRAIAALEKILSIPCNGGMATGMPLTPTLLRLDPMFDPLRDDPRFQKLAESSSPK